MKFETTIIPSPKCIPSELLDNIFSHLDITSLESCLNLNKPWTSSLKLHLRTRLKSYQEDVSFLEDLVKATQKEAEACHTTTDELYQKRIVSVALLADEAFTKTVGHAYLESLRIQMKNDVPKIQEMHTRMNNLLAKTMELNQCLGELRVKLGKAERMLKEITNGERKESDRLV